MVLNAERISAIVKGTDLENGNQWDSICSWIDFTVFAMADDYLFIITFEFIKDFVENTMAEIIHVAPVFFFFTYHNTSPGLSICTVSAEALVTLMHGPENGKLNSFDYSS